MRGEAKFPWKSFRGSEAKEKKEEREREQRERERES